MRIGIVGYGSVAAIHADAIAGIAGVEVAVWGPDPARVAVFAAKVRGGATIAPNLSALISTCDGVVIASPSGLHEAQAELVLDAGRPVLVELPACASARTGERLGRLAETREVAIRGVHSSRALAPYAAIGEIIRDGGIGSVRSFAYRRNVVTKARSWTDDALWHHAQHPIDLLIDWFGGATPVSCETSRRTRARSSVVAELMIAGGARASIEITYDDGPPANLLQVAGDRGVTESDGFSWVARDGRRRPAWDPTTTYMDSIASCDAAFVEDIQGRPSDPAWSETVAMAAIVDGLVALE